MKTFTDLKSAMEHIKTTTKDLPDNNIHKKDTSTNPSESGVELNSRSTEDKSKDTYLNAK